MKFEEKEAKPIYSRMVNLVIDADSLIYRACHAGEKEYNNAKIPREHPLFHEMPIAPMEEMQQSIFHSMIGGFIWKIREDLNLQGIDIEDHLLVFTPKKNYCDAHDLKVNFRYEIIDEYNETAPTDEQHPQYKANRTGMKLPEGIPEMFAYVATLDNALFSDHSDAIKRDAPEDIVIACLDKDIYKGTPSGDLGHFNYNKNEWIYTTEEEAKLFFYQQCLSGDSSDGIKGIYRYGPKTAEKDFPKWTNEEDMWERVMDKFIEKGYSEAYAILMMRLVNLSQLDECGDLVLWTPPVLVADLEIRGTYDEK